MDGTPSLSTWNIRRAQQEAIKDMLAGGEWKVLVYDDEGKDILAPLLNVGQLRELGVTLHLSLHATRLRVPDVLAVYFVAPTEASVARIAEDARAPLYDTAAVNFIGEVPRGTLELLARRTLDADASSGGDGGGARAAPSGVLSRVYERHVRFVALEHDLFVMRGLERSFAAFNDARVRDDAAEANVARCVDALYSVAAALGVAPVVRATRNGAAELIGRRLYERVRHRSAPASGALRYRRPLLLVVERTLDVPAQLHHPWSYQALVHELFGVRLNRVQLDAETQFDLDADDAFWAAHRGAPFEAVAAAVKAELERYKAAVARVDEAKAATGTSALSGVVASLPELRAQKRLIDTHTTLASAVLRGVQERALDRYYAAEEALLSRGAVDMKELRLLLGADAPGTAQDRARLAAIFAARARNGLRRLRRIETDATPLAERLCALVDVEEKAAAVDGGGGGGAEDEAAAESSSAAAAAWPALTSLFSDSMDKLKAMLPSPNNFFLSRLVRHLGGASAAAAVDDNDVEKEKVAADDNDDDDDIRRFVAQQLVAFDGTDVTAGGDFPELIVFVVGGGSYAEYQNVKNLTRAKGLRVLYGTTELLTSSEFLAQVEEVQKK